MIVKRVFRIRMNGPRKPVSKITDRAKRYRANAKDVRPPAPKQCGFCGRRRNVGVHHIYGDEADGAPDNLMWACKRCNAAIAALMKRLGLGKRVKQYNPPARRGSQREYMKAYGDAIKVMRGQFDGDVSAAMATIRATPREVRSAYTSRSWPVRRKLYGPWGRQSGFDFGEVPF
jgi:hypothetical protein